MWLVYLPVHQHICWQTRTSANHGKYTSEVFETDRFVVLQAWRRERGAPDLPAGYGQERVPDRASRRRVWEKIKPDLRL